MLLLYPARACDVVGCNDGLWSWTLVFGLILGSFLLYHTHTLERARRDCICCLMSTHRRVIFIFLERQREDLSSFLFSETLSRRNREKSTKYHVADNRTHDVHCRQALKVRIRVCLYVRSLGTRTISLDCALQLGVVLAVEASPPHVKSARRGAGLETPDISMPVYIVDVQPIGES